MEYPEPVSLPVSVAGGTNLEPIEAWPEDVRIAGAEPTRFRTWFEGQITAQVIEISDGVLRFSATPFDELCVVLSGSVTMTPENGAPRTFRTGDVYVIPKGYVGLFAPNDGYRAMTVMETATLRALMADWNITEEKG